MLVLIKYCDKSTFFLENIPFACIFIKNAKFQVIILITACYTASLVALIASSYLSPNEVL